ncbi:MAG: protein kinase [Deltaproteobacteria bacterium]|nr:protein kinase [Deltaproteobacteria bacterium]
MSKATGSERRQQPRVPLTVPVTWYGGEKTITWQAQDISTAGGGIFVAAEAVLEPGAEVTIGFYVPGCGIEIATDAVVAWVNDPSKPGSDKSKPRGMGLKFRDLDPEYHKVLIEYVDKRKSLEAMVSESSKSTTVSAAAPQASATPARRNTGRVSLTPAEPASAVHAAPRSVPAPQKAAPAAPAAPQASPAAPARRNTGRVSLAPPEPAPPPSDLFVATDAPDLGRAPMISAAATPELPPLPAAAAAHSAPSPAATASPAAAAKPEAHPAVSSLIDNLIDESLAEGGSAEAAQGPWPTQGSAASSAPPAAKPVSPAPPPADDLIDQDAVDESGMTPEKRALLERLADGSTLGSYRILKWLGSGGMGDVYLAEHRQLGRKVAIKRLRSDYAKNRRGLKRFFDEARAVNKIKHENIVEITDFATEEAHVYCVMEFLEGKTLSQALAEDGAIPIQRAVRIAIQVCDALDVCHRAGIIHRDLKPQNIMLVRRANQEDAVKLLDFGVAKLKEPEGALTPESTGSTLLGTPGYMSPEQLLGKSVDQRADIYALGVILYQMVTGINPFLADTWGQAVVKHATLVPQKPNEIEGIRQPLPERFESLVLSCLEKEPERRPERTAEVAAVLREVTGGLSFGDAAAPRRSTKALPARKRGRLGFVLGAGAGVVVVAVAVGATLSMRRSSSGVGKHTAAEPQPAKLAAAAPARPEPGPVGLAKPTALPKPEVAAPTPEVALAQGGDVESGDAASKAKQGRTKGRPGAPSVPEKPAASAPPPPAATTPKPVSKPEPVAAPPPPVAAPKPAPKPEPVAAPPPPVAAPKPAPKPEPAAPPPAPAAAPAAAGAMSPAETALEQGKQYLKDNKAELAIQEFEKCIALNPKSAAAYRLMGKAYATLGREAKAIDAFERFVELAPDHKDAEKLRKIIQEYRGR